jgi:hypothetical protein
MLRKFGRLLTTQTRDINVLNYPNHVVYAIFTNQGFIYVAKDKLNKSIEITESKTFVDVDEALFEKKVELK